MAAHWLLFYLVRFSPPEAQPGDTTIENNNEPPNPPEVALKRLSMIVGTSTIYTATSSQPLNIFGTWGPVPSVLPDLYHNTVGQTAAGILLDYILANHPANELASNRARQKGLSITEYLNAKLEQLAGEHPVACLTQNLHMLPYFAGNRTPRMNMTLTGMISGLRLDNSEENLALHYLCTIQALALGARHNIETLISAGYEFDLLTPAGGLAKNPLFLAEHCNATGLPAAVPEQTRRDAAVRGNDCRTGCRTVSRLGECHSGR